jgi:hypothetical protein
VKDSGRIECDVHMRKHSEGLRGVGNVTDFDVGEVDSGPDLLLGIPMSRPRDLVDRKPMGLHQREDDLD